MNVGEIKVSAVLDPLLVNGVGKPGGHALWYMARKSCLMLAKH